MTKATLIAGILAVPGNRLTAAQLETMDESMLQAITPAAAPAPVETAEGIVTANAAAKPVFNFSDMMAAAPPDVREMIQDGITTNQAVRTKMIADITTNSACAFTAEELAGMKTDALRKLHALAAKPAAPTEPTANTFNRFLGAAGIPAVTQPTENAEVPAPLLSPDWSTAPAA